jgi:FkbM family methyltransferase
MFSTYLEERVPFIITLYHWFYNTISSSIYFLTRKKKLHTYEGFPLEIFICDTVSKEWYDHDLERYEIKFLQRNNLKSGMRVFNIGAHHGVIALILAKIVGPNGKVVAVEMDKHHVEIANINKRNNNAKNLRIIHAAISDTNDKVFFSHDQIIQTSNNEGKKEVRSITVDDLTRKYGLPSLLYIDVEGYECKVLKGATKTLKYFPDCCLEVHVNNGLEQFGGSLQEIVSYFPQNKYNLFMAPAIHKCHFKPFNIKSKLTNNRFYLVALNKLV